ncbi:Eukaryotic translation initiation factor 3 subunit K [Pseudolycoriella hygida]|uniref:Eukaryotic translation initiation factor 3 subunit K n=1 Tax=Pseudolycoriella hygida TaxID=35572 RepID=A0A9Q0NGB3_9DIPT|nr:Eukaryotic translation initiation factor 3 subunit K [Pseudolycoriella hygida]
MDDGKELIIADILKSIERYNPDHLNILEAYVASQAKNNTYDLEANLAVLKLYQFNPNKLNYNITHLILLKALTNFPHTDFTLCKCLLLPAQMDDDTVKTIIYLADILESCDFALFWMKVGMTDFVANITGFYDSIRKFICHVVGITFQTIEKDYLVRLLGDIDGYALASWIKKYGWKDEGDLVFIASQDNNIKTKNITEKIEFESLAQLMAGCL